MEVAKDTSIPFDGSRLAQILLLLGLSLLERKWLLKNAQAVLVKSLQLLFQLTF